MAIPQLIGDMNVYVTIINDKIIVVYNKVFLFLAQGLTSVIVY